MSRWYHIVSFIHVVFSDGPSRLVKIQKSEMVCDSSTSTTNFKHKSCSACWSGKSLKGSLLLSYKPFRVQFHKVVSIVTMQRTCEANAGKRLFCGAACETRIQSLALYISLKNMMAKMSYLEGRMRYMYINQKCTYVMLLRGVHSAIGNI